MKSRFGVILSALLLISATTMLADTTYSTQSAFNAATSSVSTQTFANVAANMGVGVGGIAGANNPLNSTTNSAMLPGLSIIANTTLGDDIAVIGPGFNATGNNNYAVFGSYDGSSLNFAFAPGVTAVSLNVLTLYSSSDVSILIYGLSNNLLGSFTMFGAPNTGSGEFWGITSTSGSIGSVDISAANGPFVGVDQVQFGSSSSVTPEPGTMLMFGTGALGLLGTLRRRFCL